MRRVRGCVAPWALCAVCLLVPYATPAAPATPATPATGVKVALLPAPQTVAPGSDFTLSIEVTRAGSAFNAFDVYVGYDPAALTLRPSVPISRQEGAYFVVGCANRFHTFRPGVGRDTISDVLLCASTSLAGPGQIYTLRFRASDTVQVTTVRFLPGLEFYDAGLFVNPDSSSDALIGIGMNAAAPTAAVTAPAVRLEPRPNPTHGTPRGRRRSPAPTPPSAVSPRGSAPSRPRSGR